MPSLTKIDVDNLARILSGHYFAPKIKQVTIPARMETITEWAMVDESYDEAVEVENEVPIRSPFATFLLTVVVVQGKCQG